MIGAVLTKVVLFVLSLPFRILFSFRFSAIFTLLGFILGLLSGILAGYYFFIFPEPSDIKPIDIVDLSARELTPEEKKRLYKLLPPWVHSPDMERTSWFNKMLALMWPFIDKAVAAEVIAQATPIIESSKPKFIESIEFESLSLGPLPPGFIGIKSFHTMEDEVIIQPELRWVGRPNVKVVVSLFGLKLSAQVSHLYLEAPLRVTLKPLSNYFPCFSRIVISLMAPPKLDIGLSILGLDFLVFPFVIQLVENQVEAVVSDMLLWPQTMKIFDDEAKPAAGQLSIRDPRAYNLKNIVGLVGTIDPFAVFGFGKKVGNFTTAVVMDSTDPTWLEDQSITVREGADDLLIQVFHQKKPKNVLIGAAWVPLADVMQTPNVPRTFKVPLKDKVEMPGDEPAPTGPAPTLEKQQSSLRRLTSSKRSKEPKIVGQVEFELEFKPRKVREGADADADEEEDEEEILVDKSTKVGGGKLWVKLRSGRELEAKKSEYNHPIVCIKFRGEERKTQKYKEPDVDMFEEAAFTWDCDTKPDKESLHVTVFAETKGPSMSNPLALKRLLHSQQEVGNVEIPLGDAVANGRVLDDFSLVGSKGSSLKIEIRWKEKTAEDA